MKKKIYQNRLLIKWHIYKWKIILSLMLKSNTTKSFMSSLHDKYYINVTQKY